VRARVRECGVRVRVRVRVFPCALIPCVLDKQDAQGFAGGVELGLMSTTTDKDVALQYSGASSGKLLPTILEITIGKTSTGADISWLSQFECEREILFPPLTHLEIVDAHEENGVLVVKVKPTVNHHFQTTEEAVGQRKRLCAQAAKSLVDDMRHEAVKQQLVSVCVWMQHVERCDH
jgi:hypothetical protein